MLDPIRQLFDGLEESRSGFLGTLSGLDDAQLSFRSNGSSWSALQVAEHVLIAEQLATDTILRLAGRPSRRRNLIQHLGYAAVWVVLKLGLRVNMPTKLMAPTGAMTLREIRAEWAASRGRLRSYLENLEEGGLQQAGFGHPIAGPLNLREGVLFLQRHTRHHQEQIERLKRHARFPRAQAALTAGAS